MNIRHYYPFGMEWELPSYDLNGEMIDISGVENKYTYNGKELVDDLDINLHDYGARYYDPAIARFTTIDPAADEYGPISPFVYVANNPLIYIDPTGAYIEPADDKAMALYKNIYKNASKKQRKIYDRLNASDVVYRIKTEGSSEGFGGQTLGGCDQDCGSQFVLDLIIDGAASGDSQIHALGDELEHARQFEDGELGIVLTREPENRGPKLSYDLTDERKSKDAGLRALESIKKVKADPAGNSAQKWKYVKANGTDAAYLDRDYGSKGVRKGNYPGSAERGVLKKRYGNVIGVVFRVNGVTKFEK